jgi:hypothetical protein
MLSIGHAIEWAIRQGHFVNAMEKMRERGGNQLVNLTRMSSSTIRVIQIIETVHQTRRSRTLHSKSVLT